MARDWESWLRTAVRPASATEEQERDRTEKRIRDAIAASDELPSSVKVYAKGSYANNTNVRRDADVDVAVEWTQEFKVQTWGATEGMTPDQLGYTPVAEMISPYDFRAQVERALADAFGSAVDTAGDKAIDVAAGAGTLDADVVPCIQLRRYDAPHDFRVGHRLFPLSGGWIDNYPEQHLANGRAKNSATGGRYKDIVRALKRLEAEMVEEGTLAKEYPGYMLECLTYNVPDPHFRAATLLDDLIQSFNFLWEGLRDPGTYGSWVEVNDLRFLFYDGSPHSEQVAFSFIDTAWRRVVED
jgi:hypothetical protein